MADDPTTVTQLQAELQQARAQLAATQAQNAALADDLERSRREHAETQEQQTATAEILRAITTSPTDAQPVLNAITQSAMRLSESVAAMLGIRDGDTLRLAAGAGDPELRVGTVSSLSQRRAGVSALLECRTIHIADQTDPSVLAEFPDNTGQDARAAVLVPLVREGEAIGILQVSRDRAEPYSPREIALLETFADQAVIAIENA